jgi:sulfide:quinone oxidoreductase
MTKTPGMKRITVAGTGFGGLTAISTLHRLEPSAEITAISKQPDFFYYPSLIWIPSGLCSGDDITTSCSPSCPASSYGLDIYDPNRKYL